MSAIKFRIVKKEKDGVTLSPAKGADPVKMEWKEFHDNYEVKEEIWAVPSDSLLKKMDEVNEHISAAAAAFIMSGGLKQEITDVAHMAVFGEEVQKVQEILGCSIGEVLMLVRQVVDQIANLGQKEKKFKADHRKQRGRTTPSLVKEEKKESGFAILADNPELLALKEKLTKK